MPKLRQIYTFLQELRLLDPLLLQLAAFGAHCQVAIGENGPLIGGLFMAGLVGSASHCAGMCGPFVLAQVGARGEASGGLARLGGGALLPYHFGRATTYILLAAVLATPLGALGAVGGLHWIAPALLVVAAATFALLGLQTAGLVGAAAGRFAAIGGLLGVARPLFAQPRGWRGYLLGGLLGFLPCGLLYAAVAAAAATGSPLTAAFGMAGFVLGTVPMLVGIGWLGRAAAARWQGLARRAMPFIAGLNAIVLLLMAFHLATRV
jgi:sulfite exporter TauE/SafE